jgi:hypothetical protein
VVWAESEKRASRADISSYAWRRWFRCGLQILLAALAFWLTRSAGWLAPVVVLAWLGLPLWQAGATLVSIVRRKLDWGLLRRRAFVFDAFCRTSLLIALALAGLFVVPDIDVEATERWMIAWMLFGVSAVGAISTWVPRVRRTRRVSFAPVGQLALAGCIVWEVSIALDEPSEAATLLPPFANRSVVHNGGRSPLTNHHAVVANQLHALDLGPEQRGTAALFTLEEFRDDACCGAPVLAPLTGKVTSVLDGIPDLPPENAAADNPAGNHVVIHGGEHFVLLAHLARGSVRVTEGDLVKAGQVVGACGNSGNSTDPHLHIQVQNRPTFDMDDASLRTVPIRFIGIKRQRGARSASGTLYLRRNDRIEPESDALATRNL